MKLWNTDDVEAPNRHIDIINELKTLGLPNDFSIVDIACGEGRVLKEIAKAFPQCRPLGVDIEDKHWGIDYFKVMAVQDLIKSPNTFSVVLMLSSYRNWRGVTKNAFDDWVRTSHFITSLPIKVIGKDNKDFPLVRYQLGLIE